MAVTYGNFGGRIVSENRAGVEKDYVRDTLGSTAMLLDSSGSVTDDWTYWPYGEVRARTGTTPTSFTFVGTLGYFTDSLTRLYVRARHYVSAQSRWLTIDPFWPIEEPYGYCHARPSLYGDPSGAIPRTCEDIYACLRKSTGEPPYCEGNPCKCGAANTGFKVPAQLMLCVFRAECGAGAGKGTTIDPDNCVNNKGGGIGQLTPGAVKDLMNWDCNEGITDPWVNHSEQVTGANWCRGARAARNLASCKTSIDKYGPPYSSVKNKRGENLLTKILQCEQCMYLGKPCGECFKPIDSFWG